MEEFLGLFLFIIYLVFSVAKSRKEGMRKKPVGPQPPKGRRDGGKPQAKKDYVKQRTVPATSSGLGEMIQADRVAGRKKDPVQDSRQSDMAPKQILTLDSASIQKGFIWSEILQKPISQRQRRR